MLKEEEREMEGSRKPFQASKLAEQMIRQFGAERKSIKIPMRKCEDVPRFIEKMEEAHRKTAGSKLRFGPPEEQTE